MAFEDGFCIRLGFGNNRPFRGNNGGCAGIGGANHVAAQLHCTRLGLLKLLIHGIGFAVPRHIADVGKQGRAFRRCDEFVAETVFIADIKGDFFDLSLPKALGCRAFLKVGQRHIHHFIEALGNGGQGLVFTKWNEVVLGVVGDDIGSAAVIVAQIDDCIFVAVAVGRILADADGQCAAVLCACSANCSKMPRAGLGASAARRFQAG